ncbi:MAG: flavodoxin, partial [Paludibacteraceae bacterium]|nr:flavodoxin [Paludibacteraceae bacterium]
MKKFLMAITVALSLVGCGNQQKPTAEKCSPRHSTKSLVLYYSQTHVTEKVAKLFAEATSADLDSIVPVTPYNGSFTETIERCQKEMERNEKPQLIKPMNVDVAEYDTVYLGYPIWFGVAARPLEAWFMRYDLRGKVVIPFCTFGSGGLETSVAALRRMAPSVTILDGFG